VHETIDYRGLIVKLKQQILALEQENENQRNIIKKMEREKEEMKAMLIK
jgi:hypothetical protein